MLVQNLIKKTLTQETNLGTVREMLAEGGSLHRSAFADKVCEKFGFHDGTGKAQRGGCLKALRILEKKGHLVLPAARGKTGSNRPRRLNEPLAPVEGLPEQVQDVRDLKLVVVEDDLGMRTWNELMLRDHPNGTGPLVGRQLRYLIESAHGCLGALGFAAAALQLAPREEWVGWDKEQKDCHLHRVVGLSRFLIRSEVSCANLGSRVLAMAMEVLPFDFERRYGYKPYLVESFVDTASFSGTVYRAANWTRIGQTKGRGRQDRNREAAQPKKDIYVYPLFKDFRTRMGLAARAGLGALSPSEGLDGEGWIDQEFANAPLGDARWGRQLTRIAAMKAKDPTRSFCGAAEGDRQKINAYYRFIDRPDESAVNMENILAPHRKQTLRRMKGQRTVLCVSDGSDLNYDTLDSCEGLGYIGANQTTTKTRGLHLHSTLALTTSGLPLGVLASQCDAPQLRDDDSRPIPRIPLEEKESYRWHQSLKRVSTASAEMPGIHLVNICDRGADHYEFFEKRKTEQSNVDLLVRAKYNRITLLDGPGDRAREQEEDDDARSRKIFDVIKETPVKTTLTVEIRRQSARPQKGKQKARKKREAREAELSLRFMPVRLAPPTRHKNKEPVDLWLIHAWEENPPPGVEPVEWFLLTSIEIDTPHKAIECVRWYSLRWRIEDWHRVLKSGCRIEDLANKTAERLQRGIAINLVIAWRIMLMTLLGRESPDLPADILFCDLELKVLSAYAKKKHLNPPDTLGNAVFLVAKLGGYIARKSDPPPGHQILWHGHTKLELMATGFALLNE